MRKTEILDLNKQVKFSASGRSMYPFFQSGDIIEVGGVNFKDIKVGDVIFCYKRGSNLAVHRVIKRIIINNQLKLVTKGDFASSVDGVIDEKDFIGKVIAVKSKNKLIPSQLGLNKHWGPIIAKISILDGYILSLLRRAKKSLSITYRDIIYKINEKRSKKIEEVKSKSKYEQDIIKICNLNNAEEKICFNRKKWQQILKFVQREGILGISYNRLKDNFSIPSFVINKLKIAYVSILRNNLIFQNELKNLLSVANDLGIEILLLRGIALINSIYPEIGLRPMSDIDLLIKPEEVPTIEDILINQGYRREKSGQILFVKNLKYITILIELHSDVLLTVGEYRKKKFSNITADLWKRKERINIEGKEAYILAPEDLLLHQAAYLALGQGWLRLIWLYDIKTIANFYKKRLNWEMFLERVKKYNLNIPLYYVLNYTKQFFNVDIPYYIIDKLRPSKKERFKAKIFQKFLGRKPIPHISRLLYLLVQPTLSEKINILQSGLFPPKEFIRREYRLNSKNCLLYYYLKRPFVGLVKGTKIILGFLNLERR